MSATEYAPTGASGARVVAAWPCRRLASHTVRDVRHVRSSPARGEWNHRSRARVWTGESRTGSHRDAGDAVRHRLHSEDVHCRRHTRARRTWDLRLSDSLGALFPGVPADKSGITLHRLLTHTSGFPLDPANAGIAATDTREAYVEKAMRHPIPASRIGPYSYSNLGYGLLAIIVENRSGEPFRKFVDRNFIAPLGLERTAWWQDSVALATPGTATGYVLSDRENTLIPEPPFGRGGPTSPMWSKWPLGAGGMVSTVGDLRVWWNAIRSGRVLRQSLADTMVSRRDTAGNQGYGWTVGPVPQLGLRIYRGGSRTGFNSLVASYPERK